jgi:hypothetical protein
MELEQEYSEHLQNPENTLQFLEKIAVKKDFWVQRDAESEQVKKIAKEQLYAEIRKHNINMEIVSNGKRVGNDNFHKFNLLVRRLNKLESFTISDIAFYLEEDLFDFKVVVSCFNEENVYLLREELIKRFNYKKKKTKLKEFMEESENDE